MNLRHPTPPRRRLRRARALAAIAVLTTAVLGGPLTAVPAGADPAPTTSVTMSVLDVNPSTPSVDTTPHPLSVTLLLTNTTASDLPMVRVEGQRVDPINTTTALDQAMANLQPGDPDLTVEIPTADGQPLITSLPAGRSVTVHFTTTTSTVYPSSSLCLCHDAIYRLYFTAHAIGTDGSDTTVGAAQTFLPVFGTSPPQPVRVSWIWPLLDRPHRLVDNTVFVDDDLAAAVAPAGRLERMLTVLATVSKRVAMTVVIDPELIDELAVMTTGYSVQSAGPNGKILVSPGRGGPAAADWLRQLRAVLDANPGIDLQATPLDDPDIDALARTGLDWTTQLSGAQLDRIRAALGGHLPDSTFVWPLNEWLGAAGLAAIRNKGATTVLLRDAAISGSPVDGQPPAALASITAGSGTLLAATSTPAIQQLAAAVLTNGSSGASALPQLVARIAVRAAQDPTSSGYLVIAAPRTLSPSADAARAILATAHTTWSTAVPVSRAATLVTPIAGGTPSDAVPSVTLPDSVLERIRLVDGMVAALRSVFDPATAGQVLDPITTATQRIAATDFASDRLAGNSYALDLFQHTQNIENGVSIVRPTVGTYTLASHNAPLPITVTNRLPEAVNVRVAIQSPNDQPGFSARDLGVVRIPSGSNVTLHVPISVQRSGRFQVEAVLYTPSGTVLGAAVPLSIHSTALGTVGIVITTIAAGVLVVALLLRYARRLRRIRQVRSGAVPAVALAEGPA